MVTSQPIVTSGDDDDDDSNRSVEMDPETPSASDPLFDSTADAHDASYVDRHLRSDGATATSTTTDAVLSCPCCFQIVCMDCQRHDTYQHIYRAMFVMGVTVSWDRPLEYDDVSQSLIVKPTEVSSVPSVNSSNTEAVGTTIVKVEAEEPSISKDRTQDKSEVYYTVRCANCETVVAALDMRDEVYHFSGCLASA